MENTQTSPLLTVFSKLEDPRMDRTKKHDLVNIIAIAICAVASGADSWVDMETFGNVRKGWLETFLDLPNGIPSHDTFGRFFSIIDAEQFQRLFIEWVREVYALTKGQVVAIDGKTLRRSHDKRSGKPAIHVVGARASANGVALGQTKVDDKSNEITAMPALLDMLDVSGCIVTIDAMGCQKDIARKIADKNADYTLALKKNQGNLYKDVVDMFEEARRTGFAELDHDWFETVEKSRGRVETRRCWAVSDPECISYFNEGGEWANLRSAAVVESERMVNGERERIGRRHFISSLPGDAKRILGSVRSHWEVENSVHWTLDVTFGEDASRARRGNSSEILALFRRAALNLLRSEKTVKASMRVKRKLAGWDTDYLLKVITQ